MKNEEPPEQKTERDERGDRPGMKRGGHLLQKAGSLPTLFNKHKHTQEPEDLHPYAKVQERQIRPAGKDGTNPRCGLC